MKVFRLDEVSVSIYSDKNISSSDLILVSITQETLCFWLALLLLPASNLRLTYHFHSIYLCRAKSKIVIVPLKSTEFVAVLRICQFLGLCFVNAISLQALRLLRIAPQLKTFIFWKTESDLSVGSLPSYSCRANYLLPF